MQENEAKKNDLTLKRCMKISRNPSKTAFETPLPTMKTPSPTMNLNRRFISTSRQLPALDKKAKQQYIVTTPKSPLAKRRSIEMPLPQLAKNPEMGKRKLRTNKNSNSMYW
uniref:Uncharacterized protein n=1 Tax=Octactis speculum TaxID=3111310 RepID=A0A7S2GNH2_9STRA|mmetsp:Transcript_54258/g.74141  ORF Transcript_54258/g.74141 Transcript_54258/m.74141 type:complete len:111 (+) Transcript_54258:79-411(+)